jgi:hypothetical protein
LVCATLNRRAFCKIDLGIGYAGDHWKAYPA